MNKFKWSIALLALLGWTGVAQAGTIACPPGSNPACLSGFPVEFPHTGTLSDIGYVRYSSPAVAALDYIHDGKADVVVGTTGGYVVAYHADGTFLWARKTGSVPVESKPAIADIDGDGIPEVVVGAGFPGMLGGGVYVLRNDGTLKCSFTALDPTYHASGIYSSPALAHLDPTRPNEMQIVFGGFDMHIRALRPDCSIYWDKKYVDGVTDTVWSSPAIYDLDRDGQLDVIIGQDSDKVGVQWINGGMIRAFRGNGVGELPGFPILMNEVVYSSPAIGDITGTGQPAIMVGNGRCWDIAGCAPGGVAHAVTEAMFGFNASGAALSGWPYAMSGQSTRTSSPALADLDGDGKLETIITTLIKATNDVDGYVHVIRSNGTAYPGWPVQPKLPTGCSADVHYGTVAGSAIAVDLDGDGHPEIVAAGGLELVVWNRNGVQISRTHVEVCNPNPAIYTLTVGGGIYSTPTAADLNGDGKIELVVGSQTPSGAGGLYAWRFPNSVAKPDNMPWTQFRANARNTGVYTPDRIFRNGFETTP